MAQTKSKKKIRKRTSPIKLILSAFVLSLIFSLTAMGVIYAFGEIWTDESKLTMSETSILYDIDGNEAMKFFRENRDNVPLSEIPDLLESAFISTEDQRFYEHHGVDPFSIARAIVVDVREGEVVQGGSTITQQLVKNTFLTSEKALSRKVKEAVISFTLERKYTKQEILQMYLNRIYFGHGAYGVQAASELYFNKDVADLSLGEMAILAGLPKAPNHYSPFVSKEKSLERRNIVLKLMMEQGYINPSEYKEAKDETIVLNEGNFNKDKEFITYADFVVHEAVTKYGLTEDQIYRGGFHIYTHLRPRAQRSMEHVYANDKFFPESPSDQKVQSAMVILDPSSGGVAAMIGGRDYKQKALNRALVNRQPGSSLKPLAVYAPALEDGWHPYDQLVDEKMSFGDYKPSNYDGKYRGRVTMMDAIKKSINIPAVWLLNEIGVKDGYEFVEKTGIKLTTEDRNLSLALGGLHEGASPLAMAQAYSVFPNLGVMHEAHAIIKITDSDGDVIAEATSEAKQIMSGQSAYYMTEMLEEVVKDGTGTRARLDRPTAGKTGTTQSGISGASGNRDAWFVGYTPELVGAVWLGYDKTDKKHLLTSGGGRVPAQIFKAVMSDALKKTKEQDFRRPEGVSKLEPPVVLKQISDLAGEYTKEDRLIHLNWTPLYPPEEQKVGYLVQRRNPETGEFETIGETLEGSWTDEPNMEGLSDEYVVIPVNSKTGEQGPPSNVVLVEIPSESLLDLILPDQSEPSTDEQNGSDGEGSGSEAGGNEEGTGDSSGQEGTGTDPGGNTGGNGDTGGTESGTGTGDSGTGSGGTDTGTGGTSGGTDSGSTDSGSTDTSGNGTKNGNSDGN
jgi:penicillin-binding protein 2A